MIYTQRIGNLVDLGLDGELDVIVHQANIYHVFGAGLAAEIRARLPYAYKADCTTEKGSRNKLGYFSIAVPPRDEQDKPVVVNLYSQEGLSPSHTNYNLLFDGLVRLRDTFAQLPVDTIGFPYNYGCGLADGNWSVVEAIIKAVFEDSRFGIVIVKLPEAR